MEEEEKNHRVKQAAERGKRTRPTAFYFSCTGRILLGRSNTGNEKHEQLFLTGESARDDSSERPRPLGVLGGLWLRA